MPNAIAVDLGTSYTKMGALDDEGAVCLVPNASVAGGSCLFKTPQELEASIQQIKTSAEAFLKQDAQDLLVTTSSFNHEEVKSQAQKAGFKTCHVLGQEAILPKAYRRLGSKTGKIAFYDFGAGRFSFFVCQVDDKGSEILVFKSEEKTGGLKINELILESILESDERLEDLVKDSIASKSHLHQEIVQVVEKVKCALSHRHSYDFVFPTEENGKGIQKTFSSFEMGGLIGPLVDKTLECCKKALQNAELEASDVEEVVLLGGSTRIPKVQSAVSDFFGCSINKKQNPDHWMITGATLALKTI